MKRFLLIVVFLVAWTIVWLAGYDLLNVFLINHSHALAVTRSGRLFDKDCVDEVAIFGSSRAALQYVPSDLATNVYNYGIRGSNMNETLFMVRQHLKKLRRGVVIINLDPTGFPVGWRDINKYPFIGDYRFVATDATVFNALPRGAISIFDILPGLRFQGELRSNLTDYFASRHQGESFVDKGAELMKSNPDIKKWQHMQEQSPIYAFTVSDDVQCELESLYREKQKDVLIVWVVAPVAKLVFRKLIGKDLLEKFLRRQDSYPNVAAVSLLPLSEHLDNTCFYDHYHLNFRGARIFTRELKQILGVRWEPRE